MSKRNLVIICAALLLLSVFLFYRACSLYDGASELKGEYEALKVIQKAEAEKSAAAIKLYESLIAERDSAIAGLNAVIDETEATLEVKERDLKELQALEPLIEDKDELIVNLRAQIAGLTEQFTLARSIIRDKDAIIFSLTEKYEAQVQISLTYRDDRDRAAQLQLVAEKRIKVLEGQVRRTRAGSTLKSVLVAGAAGYIGYSLLRGK